MSVNTEPAISTIPRNVPYGSQIQGAFFVFYIDQENYIRISPEL